jgi:thiamine biosynthesis protein ThiS
MKIKLNNRIEEIAEDHLTVQQLLEVKKFTFKMLIIRVNGIIVKKDQYRETVIHDGDDVMVLHLISGG